MNNAAEENDANVRNRGAFVAPVCVGGEEGEEAKEADRGTEEGGREGGNTLT